MKPATNESIQALHNSMTGAMKDLRVDLTEEIKGHVQTSVTKAVLNILSRNTNLRTFCIFSVKTQRGNNDINDILLASQHSVTGSLSRTQEIQTIDVTPSRLPLPPHCDSSNPPPTTFHTPDKQTPLPTHNLFIPDVPIKNSDGTRPHPRRWIVKHWSEGDQERGLLRPLKDWDPSWL